MSESPSGMFLMADGALSPITAAIEAEAVSRFRPALLKVHKTDTPSGGGVNLSFGVAANSPEAEAFRQALGGDLEFVDYATGQLLNIFFNAKTPDSEVNGKGVNALLALLASIDPADPLEAAIGLQMAAMHHASMDAVRRALHQSGTADHQALNLSQANKCSRTFVMLLDALNRHRGKGPIQRFVVENVTVESGAQAVVGPVNGAGIGRKGAHQPHAKNDEGRAQVSALPREDAPRQSVHGAGGEGQAAMSDARRGRRQRCAEGKSEPLHPRTVRRRGKGDAPADRRTAQTGAAHGDG